MGKFTDAVIAASILIDLIESFANKGIDITVEDLNDELQRRKDERDALEKEMFPEGFNEKDS